MIDAATSLVKTVVLATSWAPLLSGLLHQCAEPSDPTCRGGAAAFRAMLRHHRGDDPAVLFQLLDKNNAFVHMHPLGLSVNRLILNELMGLEVFASSPSILLQNKLDYDVSSQDISYLQTHEMPLLLTNVGVPPQNSWHPFTEAVHFDRDTGLAVLSISKSEEELNTPQIESALGTLRYVRKINEDNGCLSSGGGAKDLQVSPDWLGSLEGFFMEDATYPVSGQGGSSHRCWLPVVYHSDDSDQFVDFLEGMLDLPQEHRPAMVIDTGGNFAEYEVPTLVDGIWVASHRWGSRDYFHHKLSVSTEEDSFMPKLVAAEFMTVPLDPLPEEYKDETYKTEILALRAQADVALQNNPVLGHSKHMPVTRDSSDYRPCKSGECSIGNLFTDAARWSADADVAFITSGGVRGPGWPEGQVSVADIWSALPFPNTLCSGYMNGVHLFQLLNYSMSVSTFEGVDTDDGGRLLQISGMKVTYNTEMIPSRIIDVQVFDNKSGDFKPLNRLKTYKFATDSYLCSAYTPYPSLLGSDTLVVEGEQPGKIESVLFQEMVADYLSATTSQDLMYDTQTQGRLTNDTDATELMILVHTEDTCRPGTYWKGDIETCLLCPVDFDVTFSKQKIEFEVTSRLDAYDDAIAIEEDTIVLKNHEQYSVAVIPKNLPDWLVLESSYGLYNGAESSTMLGPGESLPLRMLVNPHGLNEGTVYVTIGFGVLDGEDYPGCVGQDATFDVTMRVLPTEEQNQLGSIRAVGFTLFGIVAVTSISFAAFVIGNRGQTIVKALQPIFLCLLCLGVFVMGSAMIPMSIDDEIASQEGCDVKCMAVPWLICLGFSVAVSALFAKLWRINRLFNSGAPLRRVQVHAKDVAKPMLALFALNVVILLTWTLVDPLTWQRFHMLDTPWNTYGMCASSDPSSANAFFIVILVLNICALIATAYQAWKARNISDEFSETKIVGIALYSWLQLLVVGVPVLFLIDPDNTRPRYFIQVALLFAICMSMLCIIFVPVLLQIRKARIQRKVQTSNRTAGYTNTSSSRSTGLRISGLTVNVDPAFLASVRKNKEGFESDELEREEELEREHSDESILPDVAVPV